MTDSHYSYFMFGMLALNIIPWVWGTAFFLYVGTKKGWRGFIECFGWAGYVALFLGSTLGVRRQYQTAPSVVVNLWL